MPKERLTLPLGLYAAPARRRRGWQRRGELVRFKARPTDHAIMRQYRREPGITQEKRENIGAVVSGKRPDHDDSLRRDAEKIIYRLSDDLVAKLDKPRVRAAGAFVLEDGFGHPEAVVSRGIAVPTLQRHRPWYGGLDRQESD